QKGHSSIAFSQVASSSGEGAAVAGRRATTGSRRWGCMAGRTSGPGRGPGARVPGVRGHARPRRGSSVRCNNGTQLLRLSYPPEGAATMMKELDTVVLTEDLPDHALLRGDLGTVALVHPG